MIVIHQVDQLAQDLQTLQQVPIYFEQLYRKNVILIRRVSQSWHWSAWFLCQVWEPLLYKYGVDLVLHGEAFLEFL